MGIEVFPQPSSGKTVKGQYFTNSTNWTAPSNVNYVTVTARGGGGGGGGAAAMSQVNSAGNAGGSGGDTTFGNLVNARRGSGGNGGGFTNSTAGQSGLANSGQGGQGAGVVEYNNASVSPAPGNDGTEVIATVAVTPSTTYAITIGAGGNAGTFPGNIGASGGAGGSGWLALEWEE